MTPREFAYALEGLKLREERDWVKCATLIAYLGWHKEPTSVKKIFEQITGTQSGDFDRVAGFGGREEDLDLFVKHQKKPGA